MNKLSRRGIATVAAVLATAAGALAGAATSASAATAHQYPEPPACSTQELAVWVNADSANPGAGNVFYNLNYTNLDKHPCWLKGYPYAIAEDAHQDSLGAPAAVIPGPPEHPVLLVPGESAHSVLDYLQGALNPSCKPEMASYLAVGLPKNRVWRHAFFALPICSRHDVINLKVGMIQPGAA
jgi:hypothetical protein